MHSLEARDIHNEARKIPFEFGVGIKVTTEDAMETNEILNQAYLSHIMQDNMRNEAKRYILELSYLKKNGKQLNE